ncbi:zinc finger cchc-type superfamily [Holotrichia oblita]|uniref:Zinc finger cchc-type superfamily n=1 Tax=Holotrichia oblita TaxID=644536 RepID=A0ACB9TE84_HOLOL|nr:zinc finger cchc-type superfamily [Holotrichia oblita]
MQVVIKHSEDIIFVSEIECNVTSAEIMQSIKGSAVNAGRARINVVSIRPNQYGRQNATVVVPKKVTNELSRRGKFGHLKKDCQGQDKGDICMKCGKGDHKAKKCTNISFCLTCKMEGHREDQTKAPKSRRLIQQKATKLSKERGQRKAKEASKVEEQKRNSTTAGGEQSRNTT